VQENPHTLDYKPGHCNIGAVEIKKRYRIGYTGLVIMILFIACTSYYEIPRVWKFLLFIPTAYSLSGFLQARSKFCFVYGYLGIFSMTGRRIFSKVKMDPDLKKDRNKAIQLVGLITLGSVVITLSCYFLF
jgi:hypothetical protein